MPADRVFIVVGLGFGDEGKGATVDYLVRKYGAKTVVRYNGGPQAAHHIVTPEGMTHCFAQFGSGTLTPGVKTYLSRFMLVDPLALWAEDRVLREKGILDASARLTVSPRSLIVTPFHTIINQMREICRGADRHGSCGKGVGEAMSDADALGGNAFVAGDCGDIAIMRDKLKFLWGRKVDLAEQLFAEKSDDERLASRLARISNHHYVEDLIAGYLQFFIEVSVDKNDIALNIALSHGDVVFEGANGVLLDPQDGFFPYVTRTRTTLQNAETLLREAEFRGRVVRLGVLRAYGTRHGNGPFITEDARLSEIIPACHNASNEWQGSFRIGWFDMVAARYALRVAGKIDFLAITNFDRLKKPREIKICTAYQCGKDVIRDLTEIPYRQNANLTALVSGAKPIYETVPKSELLEFIEKNLGVPIAIISLGPTANDRVELRSLT